MLGSRIVLEQTQLLQNVAFRLQRGLEERKAVSLSAAGSTLQDSPLGSPLGNPLGTLPENQVGCTLA